ncbi:transporter, partial [Rhodococcus hoagii]|nr:transporter [Prescottella equi]
ENMPELNWAGGYPFALMLMFLTCASLYTIFKRRGWL